MSKPKNTQIVNSSKNISRKKKGKLRLKPFALDLFCIVCGMVIGAVIAALTKNIGFLKWLSHDVPFGIQEPIVLNLHIIRLAFGVSIHLTPGIVLFALLGLITGRFLLAPPAPPKQKKHRMNDEDFDEAEDVEYEEEYTDEEDEL